jgi:hypothetical protein
MDAPLGLSCVEASLDEPDNLTPRRLKVASLLSFLVNGNNRKMQLGNSLSATEWESHHHLQNNPHGH